MATIVAAITGGIGSGKSTALSILSKLGAHTLAADDIVRDIWENPGHPAIDQIRGLLGDDIFRAGQIDRKKVAEVVFADEAKRVALEAILHPAVRADMAAQISENMGLVPAIVVEVPLLFETGLHKSFPVNIVVVADEEIRLRRAMERDNASADEIRQRMAAQITDAQRSKHADMAWSNEGSLDQLKSIIQQDTHPWFTEPDLVL